MIADVAFVQTEGELVDVPAHMLAAPVEIDAVVAALEPCPHALDSVRVRRAVNVLLGAVLVAMALLHVPPGRYRRRHAGVEHGAFLNPVQDFLLDCLGTGVGKRLGGQAEWWRFAPGGGLTRGEVGRDLFSEHLSRLVDMDFPVSREPKHTLAHISCRNGRFRQNVSQNALHNFGVAFCALYIFTRQAP